MTAGETSFAVFFGRREPAFSLRSGHRFPPLQGGRAAPARAAPEGGKQGGGSRAAVPGPGPMRLRLCRRRPHVGQYHESHPFSQNIVFKFLGLSDPATPQSPVLPDRTTDTSGGRRNRLTPAVDSARPPFAPSARGGILQLLPPTPLPAAAPRRQIDAAPPRLGLDLAPRGAGLLKPPRGLRPRGVGLRHAFESAPGKPRGHAAVAPGPAQPGIVESGSRSRSSA